MSGNGRPSAPFLAAFPGNRKLAYKYSEKNTFQAPISPRFQTKGTALSVKRRQFDACDISLFFRKNPLAMGADISARIRRYLRPCPRISPPMPTDIPAYGLSMRLFHNE